MRLASILLLSAMSAVVLLSCGGSDDTPDTSTPSQPKETPIAFSGNLSEGGSESHARTRTPLSATNHHSFQVWAYKNTTSGTETVMKNYIVTWRDGSAGSTISNSSGWEYVDHSIDPQQSIKYWDFSASDYRFFGYTGTGVTPVYSTPGESGHPFVRMSFTAEASEMAAHFSDLVGMTLFSKLWCKENSELATQKSQPVTLTFVLPCVKVRFMFRQSAPSDVVFNLTNKSFKSTTSGVKINLNGTFTVTYPLSVASATTETWSVTPKSSGVGGTDYLTELSQDYYEIPAGKWYYVLPAHATEQGDYILSVTINNEPNPRTVIVPQQYMNWQPGFEYTYIFKITDSGGITFDGLDVVKITPWTQSEEGRDIYNW